MALGDLCLDDAGVQAEEVAIYWGETVAIGQFGQFQHCYLGLLVDVDDLVGLRQSELADVQAF